MSLLTRLSIRDFRNIEHADTEVADAGFVVVGDNGHGKTALLEAIYYFHTLRSMRGTRDKDLVRFGAPAFHVAIQWTNAAHNDTMHNHAPHHHRASAAFEIRRQRKQLTIDGAATSKLSEGLGTLPSVVVAPSDVSLVVGSPSERRQYVDILLALSSPQYLHALQQYRAALKRRNTVLRQGVLQKLPASSVDAMVQPWEPALAAAGGVLLASRHAWIAQNANRFSVLASEIGEPGTLSLAYASRLSIEPDSVTDPRAWTEQLQTSLSAQRLQDIRRGVTRVGPHRDDVHIELDGRPARIFASAGQQRTAAIALRLLEASTLEEHRGSAPMLLLDDPFAELDPRRSAKILGLLEQRGVGQVALAVPKASDIPDAFTRLPRWQVRNGVIT